MIDAELLGERFRLARFYAGLTQQEFAAAVRALGFKLTDRQVGLYEKGDRDRGPAVPPPDILLAMITVLDPPGGKDWFAECFPKEIRAIWLEGARPVEDPKAQAILLLVKERHPLLLGLLQDRARSKKKTGSGGG